MFPSKIGLMMNVKMYARYDSKRLEKPKSSHFVFARKSLYHKIKSSVRRQSNVPSYAIRNILCTKIRLTRKILQDHRCSGV